MAYAPFLLIGIALGAAGALLGGWRGALAACGAVVLVFLLAGLA